MTIMKNVEILIKLRRLTKTLAVSFIFILLAFAGSAFKSSDLNNDGKTKKSGKDSTQKDKYGFQSLFSDNIFDPTKPTITQLNPLAISFVQTYIKNYGKKLERIKIWGKPYLDLYDGILSQYGLPIELKYLSVIESDLVAKAVSRAGAVGPWQIMDFEAKRLGLKVGGSSDERSNYYKSTHAAAKILKGLYSQFNDWLLVIAAYNCGAGRVRQAIRKSGSNNFWSLQSFLPLETRNHVKKFIGTHYMFEGNGGLTTMTAAEIEKVKSSYIVNSINAKQEHEKLMADEDFTKSIEISGKYNSVILARNIEMNLPLFYKYNPNFDQLISTGKTYNLKLPVEKMQQFDEKKQNILQESLMILIGNTSKTMAP
jgi:membrane-bound lytic murein transglycosylase D